MSTLAHKPVVLLMGPTAAGKTDLVLRLAAGFPIDIVSVDSAMVYRGMDIGTGKPAREVLKRYPHQLVDILDPAQVYSAGQFVRDARAAIKRAHECHRLPVLVGGTMLYFRALRRGLAELPAADPAVRAEIDAQARAHGWDAVHRELARVDAQSAARIHPTDAQRIQRALEVYQITGRSLSELHAATPMPQDDWTYHACAWAPSDRQRLYAAIQVRFENMMKAGFLEEVRVLYTRGDLHSELPSIRSVGYRQLWEHLRGDVPLGTAIERAVLATKHLARRQLIWLRADRGIQVMDALESGAVAQMEAEIAKLCEVATR